ncbi:MAG: dihydrofolate reductase [Propionicimonas sp.]
MRIIGIAIVGSNGVIGDGHSQPFEIAEDWARFKQVTLGHPLIMGRRTHDAIGRWLPGRTTIVVTGDPSRIQLPTGGRATGYAVASLEEALDLARSLDDEIYVAGGGSIYHQAWPELTELDLTRVDAEADGTVFFPPVEPTEWQEVSREPRDGFSFVRYVRQAESALLD